MTPDQLMQMLPSRERLRRRPMTPILMLKFMVYDSILEEGSRRFAFQVEGLKDGQVGTIIVRPVPSGPRLAWSISTNSWRINFTISVDSFV
jgi:hypothetical protein